MVFTMHVYILGGSKNNFIFSKKVEKLQEFVTHLFMGPFEKLEKIFNLNRSFDMWLIDKVFHIVGHKDRKQYLQYPATFCNVSKPYDKEITWQGIIFYNVLMPSLRRNII